MADAGERALEGDPVRVAAPAVLEVAYGIELAISGDERHIEHIELLGHYVRDGLFRVVPLDARAALVAGRLRARCAQPPARRRGDRRSKPMRQVAWLLDIQIAATAFASGLHVATANRADFEQIADALTTLFPTAPALEVAPAPV
jgi:predicted nucleic acid-binding protein